jgi:hypothetical protein
MGNRKPSASGVGIEIVVSDAGAAFGEPPALDFILWNSFAI